MPSELEEELAVLAADGDYATPTRTTSRSTSSFSTTSSTTTTATTTFNVTQIALLPTFNYTQRHSSPVWTEGRVNFVVAMAVVACFLLVAGALLFGLMLRNPSYRARRGRGSRRRRHSRLLPCCRARSKDTLDERGAEHSAAESGGSEVMVIRQVEAHHVPDDFGLRRPQADDAFPWRLPPPSNRLPPLVRPAKVLPQPRVGSWHDADAGAEAGDVHDSRSSARKTRSYVIRVNSAS